MRVLALYTTKTLSLVRRVMAPFSVLNTRGYSFSFLHTESFDADLSYGYEVTLLQNWVLTPQEREALTRVVQSATAPRACIYDLTDPALLENASVRETLKIVTGVTVPNEVLAKQVKAITRSVRVLPSVVDVPYFVQGRSTKPIDDHPVVGCFGPHDWYLVREAVSIIKGRHPQVEFIGDEGAVSELGKGLVTPALLECETYPGLLNLSWCGLCPFEGHTAGYDTIWASEYGILGKPVIVASGSPYLFFPTHTTARHKQKLGESALVVSTPMQAEGWVKAMETLLYQREERAWRGKNAFERANQDRSTLLAGVYRTTYEAMLPHLVGR